jgi:hypothetical protein
MVFSVPVPELHARMVSPSMEPITIVTLTHDVMAALRELD